MQGFKVKAFGMIAEKLPASEFEFPYRQDTSSLLSALKESHPVLRSMKFSLAIDRQLAQEEKTLKGGEEIGLLPPFSGG